jgi:hypothetical protein
LSLAVPFSVIVVAVIESVDAEVGPVIAIAGGVVSAETTVQPNVCDVVITPFEIVTFTEYVPGVVGVPEMKPVDAINVRPLGRPVTLYETGRPDGSRPTSCNVACW